MLFDDGSAFEMLYDLAPEKVERFIIMPYLAEIFDDGTKHEKYWKFLRDGYGSWVYTLIDEVVVEQNRQKYNIMEHYPRFRNIAEPSSVVLSLISTVLGLDAEFELRITGEEYKYPQIVCDRLYGELFHKEDSEYVIVPFFRFPREILKDEDAMKKSGILERMILDDDGKPLELGHVYNFNFEAGLGEPEKFATLVELWEKDDNPAQKLFVRVQHYYDVLKDKYLHADELDDDDF